MWHQPWQRCKYTTSVDIQKTRYKKLVTRVESHASAVSLIESGEQRYIRAINKIGASSSDNEDSVAVFLLSSQQWGGTC